MKMKMVSKTAHDDGVARGMQQKNDYYQRVNFISSEVVEQRTEFLGTQHRYYPYGTPSSLNHQLHFPAKFY